MAQGYNDRLDESLGNKHKGAHKQSLKDRRDESKAMSKKRALITGISGQDESHACGKA